MKLTTILNELSNPYTIYCDLDGVLGDFVTQFKKISNGVSPNEYEDKHGSKKFFDLIHSHGTKWWETMPWMTDGKKLWNHLKQYNPIVLSAPTKSPISVKGKKVWINKNLAGNKFIITPRKNKIKYVGPNNILIDDYKKTTDEWKSKGGIAILHKNTADTIKQLEKILNK